MGKQTLKKLKRYQKKHCLTDRGLAARLDIYHIYLYRWRRAGRIIGAYERIIEDFFKKEEDNGRL